MAYFYPLCELEQKIRENTTYIIDYNKSKYFISKIKMSEKLGGVYKKFPDDGLVNIIDEVDFTIQSQVKGDKKPTPLKKLNFAPEAYRAIGYLLENGFLEEYKQKS